MKNSFRYILFLWIMSCTEYIGEINEDTSFEKVTITFTGLGDEFHNKGVFSIIITDNEKVKRLSQLKNKSKKDYFTAHRPVLYEIDVLFTESRNTDDFLLRLISTPPNNQHLVQVGYYSQYLNENLFNYVASLIKLEEIKKYEGRLSQEEYDRFIRYP